MPTLAKLGSFWICLGHGLAQKTLRAYVPQLDTKSKPPPADRENSMLQSCPPAVPACCAAASASPSQHRGKETHASQLQTFTGHYKSSNVQRNASSHVTAPHLHPTYTLFFKSVLHLHYGQLHPYSVVKPYSPQQVKNKQIYE